VSFFPRETLIPKDGSRSFLLTVNPHGEAVMYLHDDDGRPKTMATGKVEDVLCPAVTTDHQQVVRYLSKYPTNHHPHSPLRWRGLEAYHSTWADYAQAINKRGIRAERARVRFETMCDLGLPLEEYLEYDVDSRSYRVTAEGEAVDAQTQKLRNE